MQKTDRSMIVWREYINRAIASKEPRAQSLRKFLVLSLLLTGILMTVSIIFKPCSEENQNSGSSSCTTVFGIPISRITISSIVLGLVQTLPLVAVGISSSAVAAALFELFHKINEELGKENNQRQLRQFFSCPDADPDLIPETVAIVLPARSLRDLIVDGSSGQAGDDQSEDPWIVAAQKDLSNLKSPAAMGVDLIAALALTSAFSKSGLPIPEVIFDNQIIDNMNPNEDSEEFKKFKTFISIGLFSNRLTCWLNREEMLSEDRRQRYFKLVKRNLECYDNQPLERAVEFEIKQGEFCRDEGLPWYLSPQSIIYTVPMDLINNCPVNGVDYGIFSKIKSSKPNKTFIVLGATGESGTENFGKYVSQKWEAILEKVLEKANPGDKDKYLNIKDYSFSQIYKIDSNKNNKIDLVDTCARPSE